ncbi:DUF1028 domain-containing protein [bacterium]|nr:DUF1028 domain-containing protein [bacterium]
MKRVLLLYSFLILFSYVCFAEIPVHTYSIVARDPETGEMGVAVQSHYFTVGPVVPWAEAGVGVVATQSLVDVSYGPLGLQLMREGKTAEEALQALLSIDKGKDGRQVAMIDAKGNVAAHTGPKSIAAAGHQSGTNFSVQANLMASEKVWPAMAKAYQSTKGELAERLIAALDAAQEAGGDIRGQQSAAIVVVSGKKTGNFFTDQLVDLRVDDHPKPLQELRRLWNIQKAYRHLGNSDEFIEKKDFNSAKKEYDAAIALYPDNEELPFWYALGIYRAGNQKEALEIFGEVFAKDRVWYELIDRLPASDLLPAADVPKIKAVGPSK